MTSATERNERLKQRARYVLDEARADQELMEQLKQSEEDRRRGVPSIPLREIQRQERAARG